MSSEIVGEMREASASIKKGNGNQLSFVSTWKFLVLTDSVNVSREEVLLGTPGLPVVGLIYGWINAMCISKSCVRAAEPTYWHVTCEFETGKEDQKQDPANPGSGSDFSGNPLPNPDPTTWIPVLDVNGVETKQKVLNYDFSSPPKPIVNSAKQKFAEPLTRTYAIASFTGTQFEDPSIRLKTILDRNDKINTSAFTYESEVFSAKTLKLNVVGAQKGYWGNYAAWRVTYKFTYDPEGWEVDLLDVGPNFNDAGTLKPYMDETGVFRIVGNLTTGGAKLTPSTADPEELTFLPYRTTDFTSFIRT